MLCVFQAEVLVFNGMILVLQLGQTITLLLRHIYYSLTQEHNVLYVLQNHSVVLHKSDTLAFQENNVD